MPVGIDIGTMNLVAARQNKTETKTRRMRDAFLDLPLTAKRVLKLSGADYIEHGDDILLLGDQSMELAALFGREARRPLSGGLVAAGEMQALDVLAYMIKHLVGEPKSENEVCYYSVPARPIDEPDRDIVYHSAVFGKILEDLGYEAHSSNEAMAIVYSEAIEDNFSALAFSFGSGMTNVALGYGAVEAMSFSVARGGDWIDKGAGRSIGSTAAKMCGIKEAGIDLSNPNGREEQAIVYYYEALVEYVLEWVSTEFKRRGLERMVTRPIPIIISGGTSAPDGFFGLFSEIAERAGKKLPLQISEIRLAEETFDAVARGLLVQAMQEG